MNDLNLYLSLFQIFLTFLIFFKLNVLTKNKPVDKLVRQEIPIEDPSSLMERYRREVANRRFSNRQ
jgi:hypothetical protein